MNPFRNLFSLAVLLLFLLISIPIGILMLVLDIDLTYEENAPEWVTQDLPHRADTSEGKPFTLERAIARKEALA